VEEFSKWCNDVAHTHGYTVTIGAIGEDSTEDIDSSSDTVYPASSQYATQTAIFIRQDSDFKAESVTQDAATSPSSMEPSVDSDFSVISHNDESSFKSTKCKSVASSDDFEIIEDKEGHSSQIAKTAPVSSPADTAPLDLDFFLNAEMTIPMQDDPEEEKQSIIDLTFNVILDIGQEIEDKSRDARDDITYEAELWLVWMSEEIRRQCQGRLDHWLDAIGITFYDEGFACNGEITMIVKDSDLYLSIQAPPVEEAAPQDLASASSCMLDE
jgi:hypothetical protein